MSTTRLSPFFSILFSLFLTGCGGGDSNSSGNNNASGSSSSGTVNSAPSVDAGSDLLTDERSPVVLQGSASDSDGEISSIAWTQLSGMDIELQNSTELQASFNAPSTNEVVMLVFQLQVTDNNGTSSVDEVSVEIRPALEVALSFPVNHSQFNGDILDVSGTVRDFRGNWSEVDVLVTLGAISQPATLSENGFWRVNKLPVPENDGDFLITVSAEDDQGQSAQTEALINNEIFIESPRHLLFNNIDNEVYFYDYSQHAVIAVDLESGVKRELSGPNRGSGPDLNLEDMEIDLDLSNAANSRLIGLENSAVVAINIETGNRTMLVTDNVNPAPVLINLSHIVLDAENDIAYVARRSTVYNATYYEIIEINLATETRTIVSGLGIGNGDTLLELADLAFDVENATLYAHDAEQMAIIKIALNENGDRTVFSSSAQGDGPTEFLAGYFNTLYFNANTSTLYSASINGNKLFSVSNDGEREELVHNISAIETAVHGAGMATNSEGTELFIMQRDPYHLMTLDLQSQTITEIFNVNVSAARPIVQSSSIYFDEENTLLYQANKLNSEGLVIGKSLKSYVPGSGTSNLLIENFNRRDMQIDENTSAFYSASDYQFSLYSTSLNDLNETVLSNALIGTGEIFDNTINQFAVNIADQKIYALSRPYENLMEIDIATGNRNYIATAVDMGINISTLAEMKFNAANGLIYISAYPDNQLVLHTIDPATGLGALVTDFSFDEDFSSYNFSISATGESVFLTPMPGSVVGNSYLAKMRLDDLSTTILADNESIGRGITLQAAGNILLDENEQRAFVEDSTEILLIDLVNGNRVRLLQAH